LQCLGARGYGKRSDIDYRTHALLGDPPGLFRLSSSEKELPWVYLS
jgi:hypothetical protein